MTKYAPITGVGNDIDDYLIDVKKANSLTVKNIKKIFRKDGKFARVQNIDKNEAEMLLKHTRYLRKGGTVHNVLKFLGENLSAGEDVNAHIKFVKATTQKALRGQIFIYADAMAWYDPLKEEGVDHKRLKTDLDHRLPTSSGALIIDGYAMEYGFMKDVIEKRLKTRSSSENFFVSIILPDTSYCTLYRKEILKLISTYSIDYVFGTVEEYSALFSLAKKYILDAKTLTSKIKPISQRFPLDTTTAVNLLQTLCCLEFSKNTKSIITCHEYGALLFHNRFSLGLSDWKVYEPAVHPINTNFIHTFGAGDYFTASFMYYLLYLRKEEIFDEDDPYDERDVIEQWQLKLAMQYASDKVSGYLETIKK